MGEVKIKFPKKALLKDYFSRPQKQRENTQKCIKYKSFFSMWFVCITCVKTNKTICAKIPDFSHGKKNKRSNINNPYQTGDTQQ